MSLAKDYRADVTGCPRFGEDAPRMSPERATVATPSVLKAEYARGYKAGFDDASKLTVVTPSRDTAVTVAASVTGCEMCQKPVEGKARYCSAACRQRASRARRA